MVKGLGLGRSRVMQLLPRPRPLLPLEGTCSRGAASSKMTFLLSSWGSARDRQGRDEDPGALRIERETESETSGARRPGTPRPASQGRCKGGAGHAECPYIGTAMHLRPQLQQGSPPRQLAGQGKEASSRVVTALAALSVKRTDLTQFLCITWPTEGGRGWCRRTLTDNGANCRGNKPSHGLVDSKVEMQGCEMKASCIISLFLFFLVCHCEARRRL